MSKIIILEGPRGTGKSTVARAIREKISEVTLINPTGFHLDGHEGLMKVSDYYWNWMLFLHSQKDHDSTLLFDRFFFSEIVYSELYKNYDFSSEYMELVSELPNISADVHVIYMTINDEKDLKNRLNRDKVSFSKAEESCKETFLQQLQYDKIFEKFSSESSEYYGLKFDKVDTSLKSQQEVENEIFELLNFKKTKK